MEIHLSRRRTLSEKQRRKKIVDPTHVDGTHHEWPMKTRIRIFRPFFEWNESIHLERPLKIGSGKFSSVFKCRLNETTHGGRDEADRHHKLEVIDGTDDRLETTDEVAVKVLEKSTIISQNMTTQICQERRIQEVCSHHPFVLPLLQAWQDDRRLYMALPMCNRGQLFSLWASKKSSGEMFPPIAICVAALQLSSALQHIQTLGVIYRDLKLDNVLISKRGDLQISDFGLSKWLGRHERTKTICGTLAYMAPEVLQGASYGHAADWWSLGVLLHCLTAMKFPFTKGSNHTEMLKNILGSDNVDLDEATDKGVKVLVKCLMIIDEQSRLTSFNHIEHCCNPSLTYEEMVNNNLTFLASLDVKDDQTIPQTTSEAKSNVSSNDSSRNDVSHEAIATQTDQELIQASLPHCPSERVNLETSF